MGPREEETARCCSHRRVEDAPSIPTRERECKILLSVFRPWTLLAGDPRIPSLALLGLAHERLVDVYATSGTGSAAGHVQSLSNVVAWGTTWDAYLRGNVVSDAAAMLIRSFLLKTIAATGATMELDHNSSDDGNEPHDPETVSYTHLTLPTILLV